MHTAHIVQSSQTIAAIYSSHHGWLLRWLRGKLPCADQAADLAHDTFVRLLTAPPAAMPALREPRAYLTTVAQRLLIDHYRRLSLEQAWCEVLAQQPELLIRSPTSAIARPAAPSTARAGGEVESEGIDLQLSGSPLPGWQIAGGYTRVMAKYTRDDVAANIGQRLATDEPKQLFKLSTSYQPGGSLVPWRVGASLQAQDSRVAWPVMARRAARC